MFLSLLSAFWVWIPSWRHFSRLSGLLVLLPFLLPYGFIPLRLNSRRFQSGLTLAIAMGCALVVPGVYLIRFVLRWEKNWWILGNLILALLMQPVLVVIATKTFIAMPHPPRWRIKLLGSLAYGVLLCGLFLVSYSPVPRYLSDNENSALGNLFHCALSFHIANMTPNADPPCKVPCGWVVAPQKTSDGYFFEYVAISSPMTTEGCRRFKSFAMTARPLTYGRTGIRSFLVDLVDESIVVHATSENRPANASDPIVWTEDDYFSRRVPP